MDLDLGHICKYQFGIVSSLNICDHIIMAKINVH